MAGSKSILDKVKGLFRKEQAQSKVSRPISARESREVAILVQQWVKAKGYRLPHRTVTEAAENIGTTSVKLHRYCIKCLGKDFRAWRTSLRIEDAKTIMLQEPDLSTTNIAQMVGIQDRSNFFRQFFLITGMSPEKWRELHVTNNGGA